MYCNDYRQDTTKSRREKNFIEKNKTAKRAHFIYWAGQQAQVFFEGFGQKLTFDLGSCSILYAFASADMLELPNGIPVGRNIITKGPVIFDILKRTNLNVGIIGTSGSGKSYTTKILIYQFISESIQTLTFTLWIQLTSTVPLQIFLGMEKLDITGEDELGFGSIPDSKAS